MNILKEQQEKNKELIQEIESLKKQLVDKEENLKLKIWHVTGQSTDAFWYKKLNKKWLEEGKLRMEIDPQETREWAKNCKKVCFNNITIKEMLGEFCDSSKELASTCSDYISRWSVRGYQLTDQKEKYENQIAELNKYKEQVEDLAGEVRKLLNGYSKSSEEAIENGRIYWEIGEPKELFNKICGEYSKLSEVIMRIIDKWETDAKIHFISLTEVSKKWNDAQKAELQEEVKESLGLLEKEIENNEILTRKNESLQKELKEQKELLRKAQEIIESQEVEKEDLKKEVTEEKNKTKKWEERFRLATRSLPKVPSKFKILKEKTKTKSQHLIEKIKHKSQELIARIEVKVK